MHMLQKQSQRTWGPGEDTGSDLLVYAALSTLPVNFTNVKAYLLQRKCKNYLVK